jgi:cytosine/adenosine deaminase-related metal-dependent hydrolase
MELVIRNARLHTSGDSPSPLVDVLVEQGRFAAIEPAGAQVAEIGREIDVHGAMVSPPYVEPHVHLALASRPASHGGTRAERSGRESPAGRSERRC